MKTPEQVVLEETEFILAWLKETLKYFTNYKPEVVLKDIKFLETRFRYSRKKYNLLSSK